MAALISAELTSIYIIMPIMSLVIVMNGPVAIAGSTFIFSNVSGTNVPKIAANITTAKREMDTDTVVCRSGLKKKKL